MLFITHTHNVASFDLSSSENERNTYVLFCSLKFDLPQKKRLNLVMHSRVLHVLELGTFCFSAILFFEMGSTWNASCVTR
jgi:hypothetical protein